MASAERAAALIMLALHGSAYLYQGEELGLHEVGDLPAAVLQDPAFYRSHGKDKGRDGCRVPLPWNVRGPSLGFGPGPAHLPQPKWFAAHSVEAEQEDPASTLCLYRRALSLRKQLQVAEELEWVEEAPASVLHFRRPGGWQSVTNFGPELVGLPRGSVLVTSAPLDDALLPSDATAWVMAP